MRLAILPAVAVVAAVIFAAPALAAPAKDGQRCFRSSDFQSFRPIDDHSFVMRLRSDQVYRVELQDSCPALLYPQATLGMGVRGSGLVCGPVDWDLTILQPGVGIGTPCIVRGQTALTREEVAALPRRQRP